MIVSELVALLTQFDPNKEVVIEDADEGNDLELTEVSEGDTFVTLGGDYRHRIKDRPYVSEDV